MKTIFVLFALITNSAFSYCQIQDPVKISYGVKKINDQTYEIHLLAVIDKGWHIYSQEQNKEAVASPTKIVFAKNTNVVLIGKPKELGQKITNELKDLGIVNLQYEDKVDFVQRIIIKKNPLFVVKGSITYQVCTEVQCLPDKTIDFTIPIK